MYSHSCGTSIESTPPGPRPLRRLIGSGAGIIFKGSGFYETDYKRARKKPSESETKDKPSEPSKPKKDDTSSSTPDKKSG